MIDPEKLTKELESRIVALDRFIAEHRQKVNDCDAADSKTMNAAFESIGKLQARKNECGNFILLIKELDKK